MELIAIIISVAALVFSAISWRKSHQVGCRQLEIEESREDDRKSGKLNIRFEVKGDWGTYIIKNEGDIGLSITEILWNEKPIPNAYEIERIKLPIEIPPTNEVVPIRLEYDLSTSREFLPPLLMTVKWTTIEGKEETMKATVTLI